MEVLIGKTLEQSLLEVLEEEELANLRHQQHQFEEIRNAELVEMQRLQEQERRRKEEKVFVTTLFPVKIFFKCFLTTQQLGHKVIYFLTSTRPGVGWRNSSYK